MNATLSNIATGPRHSFRRLVPAGALAVPPPGEAAAWTGEDVKLFVLSFTAFFVVFSTFIA